MAGIGDKALGKLDSKNKFNGGVELEEDYGVNLYSTFYRQYDPQMGRFGGVDVLGEKTLGMSAYQFGNNNPISLNDPTGAWVSQVTENNARYNAWGSSRDKMDEYENENGAWIDNYDPITYFDNGGGSGFGGEFGSDGGGGSSSSGDYSGFWNDFLGSAFGDGENGQGFTATSTTRYYNYSNLSGSGNFETPNNDGVYTEQVGEMYHFIGATDAISYAISGDAESEKLTWWDYTKTSLELTGAVLETTVGVLTSETGIGAVAAVDGGARVAGSFTKLMVMIGTGRKSEIPTNAGAIVGNAIDQIANNSHGQAQAVLGFTNDVGALWINPESGYKTLDAANELIDGRYSPNTWLGIYDDGHSIYESFK